MSDKKDVPEWQKQSNAPQSEADAVDTSTEQPSTSQEPSDRMELLEQARTFLDHDEIRDATTESKIQFLEEKGLTNTEIHELLGISRNETTAPEPAADTVQRSVQEIPSSSPQTTDSTRSAPPIITYPEFLLHASKPPPLITPTRILNALYAGSVVGATIYGASKFIFQPMFENLSEARHDLFSLTKDQLEPLNKELEGVVSKIPPAARTINVGHERRVPKEEDSDDNSSVVSDPTEMFHRDVGVQTSPEDAADTPAETDKTSTAETAEKLSTLKDHLFELLHSSTTSANASGQAKNEFKELEVYLDQLRYGSGGTGYGALSGDDGWRNQLFGAKVVAANKKTDAVEDFKSDIRAMKGTLLSARNFPRGGERVGR